MPLEIDQITRKKLIIVKQLYQNALIQSTSTQVVVNRLMAVIGFDLAVETVLRAIYGAFELSKNPKDGFPGLVDQCNVILTKKGFNPVPDKVNILFVHSIRNDVQHKAKYPNTSDVSDCRTYVRDFLQKIIFEIWGLDFETISLTDIIQHAKVKQFLIDAENEFSQGNFQQTVQFASAGLTFALNRVEKAIVGRMDPFTMGILLVDGFGEPRSRSECEAAYRTLEKMQNTLLYITLGMNYSHFMEYKKIAGHVYFSYDGTPHFQGQFENVEQKDAEFALSYATNTIVQIESIVGNIDTPFGIEHWY